MMYFIEYFAYSYVKCTFDIARNLPKYVSLWSYLHHTQTYCTDICCYWAPKGCLQQQIHPSVQDVSQLAWPEMEIGERIIRRAEKDFLQCLLQTELPVHCISVRYSYHIVALCRFTTTNNSPYVSVHLWWREMYNKV